MQQNIHGGDIYSRQIRLDFSVNGNPLGMPDAAVQAIHEAVQHVGEYPDITAAALTEAVSRMLSGECGREIPKEYLLFGNGASELFLAVVHALKPRNIVIPVPSFYGYEYVAEAAGSHIKYVYLLEKTGFRPGRELLQELTADTDMLFVANPNNPTGQLMGREYLQELERDIMIYDVSLQTGNRALDVVLMEKGLFCKNHEIQWSCMVDGSRMNFMKAEDIYGIFGNALDNAIEAVSRLEDPQQRVISVKAIYQKKILVIQFQNYYQGDLEFRNGIPRTTKQNKQDHGYGMKSIRYTVEKYNGTVTVSTKNNILTLQILIPLA